MAFTPHAGRVVPELMHPDIREVPAYPWRVIYDVHGGRVVVLAVVHKRRQIGRDDVTQAGGRPTSRR